MVQTRRQQAEQGNVAPQQPSPEKPAPKKAVPKKPVVKKPAVKKPVVKKPTPQQPKPQQPKSQQPAQQPPAPPKQSIRAEPRKVAKPAEPTNDDDEDEEAVVDNAIDDDVAAKPKTGKKRKTSAVNEGPSQKVSKTGSAGPSNSHAEGPGLPPGDAASGEQAQHKREGKGKGKAKENEAPATLPDWFEPADGTQNHFEGSKSQQKFQDARAATLKEWSGQPPDHDRFTWKGGAGLGAGAFGAAWAFYRDDGRGIIIDRIAVKDTALRRDHWTDWVRWWGVPWDAKNREHMEIKVMEDIADNAKANRCVLLRGSAHYDEIYTYRIIMNYCPLGSMHSANPGRQEHLAPKKARKTKDESHEIHNDGKHIAEPLVWKWFEDLAKACVLLEKGKDLPSGSVSRLSGHHVIVHRDIKPPNIFLDQPSGIDGDWPEYPVATLGDFGSACYTNDDDEHNPMSYNYCEGTPGFRPLELCSMSDPITKRYKSMGKLGSATNIWSLGASLISICNRDNAPKTDFYTPENSIPTFNENAQHVYSQALRDLLNSCVQYRGHDRISAQDLLESISQHTGGTMASPGDVDLARGMRLGQSESADAKAAWRFPVKELYRLHMSYDKGEAERATEKQHDADENEKEKQKQKKEAADAEKAEKATKAAAAKLKKAAAAEKRKKAKK